MLLNVNDGSRGCSRSYTSRRARAFVLSQADVMKTPQCGRACTTANQLTCRGHRSAGVLPTCTGELPAV